MPAPSIVMGLVALVCAIAGIAVFSRATTSEASVYRHRIIGTILMALGASLFLYAFALHGWEGAA